MPSHTEMINEINMKYITLEAEVDKKLEKAKRDEEKLAKLEKINLARTSLSNPKILSYEDALIRNSNLLKAVEMAKARLRSRSTFSPIERILEKAIENYRKDIERTRTDEKNLDVNKNPPAGNLTADSAPVDDTVQTRN